MKLFVVLAMGTQAWSVGDQAEEVNLSSAAHRREERLAGLAGFELHDNDHEFTLFIEEGLALFGGSRPECFEDEEEGAGLASERPRAQEVFHVDCVSDADLHPDLWLVPSERSDDATDYQKFRCMVSLERHPDFAKGSVKQRLEAHPDFARVPFQTLQPVPCVPLSRLATCAMTPRTQSSSRFVTHPPLLVTCVVCDGPCCFARQTSVEGSDVMGFWHEVSKRSFDDSQLVNALSRVTGTKSVAGHSASEQRSKKETSPTLLASDSLDEEWWLGKPFFKTVRAFRFTTHGELHQVAMAHCQSEWQLAVDGRILNRVSHSHHKERCLIVFQLVLRSGSRLDASISMTWSILKASWTFQLSVDGHLVPACWKPGLKRPMSVPPCQIGDSPRTSL
eukprot:CAMPEP_0194489996 /NCGR_PEP_ID=MMETSP0253-20130528/9366_1 /TAXON_ID=2966 /ORGANISM="Noctiluca scintillans" /LENGTH=391 /DNA_ID=CAMNT_0039330567 /DNA_START=121 /DNA_END=1298 /DNA_ORIENTATION=-